MRRSIYTLLRYSFLNLTLAYAMPAFAQETPPPDSQLKAPASGQIQAPTRVDPPSASADPCPTPQAALGSTPDDLAKVQEDIDRFTLCVQRAQLLERLNESALKSQTATDVTLGYAQPPAATGGMAQMMPPGVAGPQTAGFAPLPAAALAGADVSPLPPSLAPAAEPAATPEPEPEIKEWTIREISGSGGQVEAKLLSPEGDEVQVTSGMKLPDGKTVIVRITPAGVTVREGKSTKTLEWSRS